MKFIWSIEVLSFSVENLDKLSKIEGKMLDLRDQVIKKMKATKDLGYKFVSRNTALKSLSDGNYYMTVTFPADFSSSAASRDNQSSKSDSMGLNYNLGRWSKKL